MKRIDRQNKAFCEAMKYCRDKDISWRHSLKPAFKNGLIRSYNVYDKYELIKQFFV